jgi:hypothetical protein
MITNDNILKGIDTVIYKETLTLESEVKYGDISPYMYWSQALRKTTKKNYQTAYDMVYNMNQNYIKQLESFTLKDQSVLGKFIERVFKQDATAPLRTAIDFVTVQPEIEQGLFEIYFASAIAGTAEFKSKVQIATTFSPANQYSIDYYKYLTDKRSKYLIDTNKKRLSKILKSSATEGLTLKETKSLIIKNLKDTAKIAARAESIAVTETTISLNWAKYNAGANTNVKMVKTWYTTGNNRVRSSHSILDGVTIPYEDVWITGNGNAAAYPGDENLPSEDVVQCVCTFGQAPLQFEEKVAA